MDGVCIVPFTGPTAVSDNTVNNLGIFGQQHSRQLLNRPILQQQQQQQQQQQFSVKQESKSNHCRRQLSPVDRNTSMVSAPSPNFLPGSGYARHQVSPALANSSNQIPNSPMRNSRTSSMAASAVSPTNDCWSGGRYPGQPFVNGFRPGHYGEFPQQFPACVNYRTPYQGNTASNSASPSHGYLLPTRSNDNMYHHPHTDLIQYNNSFKSPPNPTAVPSTTTTSTPVPETQCRKTTTCPVADSNGPVVPAGTTAPTTPSDLASIQTGINANFHRVEKQLQEIAQMQFKLCQTFNKCQEDTTRRLRQLSTALQDHVRHCHCTVPDNNNVPPPPTIRNNPGVIGCRETAPSSLGDDPTTTRTLVQEPSHAIEPVLPPENQQHEVDRPKSDPPPPAPPSVKVEGSDADYMNDLFNDQSIDGHCYGPAEKITPHTNGHVENYGKRKSDVLLTTPEPPMVTKRMLVEKKEPVHHGQATVSPKPIHRKSATPPSQPLGKTMTTADSDYNPSIEPTACILVDEEAMADGPGGPSPFSTPQSLGASGGGGISEEADDEVDDEDVCIMVNGFHDTLTSNQEFQMPHGAQRLGKEDSVMVVDADNPSIIHLGGMKYVSINAHDYVSCLKMSNDGHSLCLKLMDIVFSRGELTTANVTGRSILEGKTCEYPKLPNDKIEAILNQAKMQYPDFNGYMRSAARKTITAMNDKCKKLRQIISRGSNT